MRPPIEKAFLLTNRDRIAGVVIGFFGGFIVGLTSVGSGVFFALTMLFVFPLKATKVVGTDIFHAAALLYVAGAGHFVAGNVDVSTIGWLLVGSIPGVLIGSQLTASIPERALRAALAATLGVAGLKLDEPAGQQRDRRRLSRDRARRAGGVAPACAAGPDPRLPGCGPSRRSDRSALTLHKECDKSVTSQQPTREVLLASSQSHSSSPCSSPPRSPALRRRVRPRARAPPTRSSRSSRTRRRARRTARSSRCSRRRAAGKDVDFDQSYGASGEQSRAVHRRALGRRRRALARAGRHRPRRQGPRRQELEQAASTRAWSRTRSSSSPSATATRRRSATGAT